MIPVLPWVRPLQESEVFKLQFSVFSPSGVHSSSIFDWTTNIHSGLKSSSLMESKQQAELPLSSSGFSCFTVTCPKVVLSPPQGSGGESWAARSPHDRFTLSTFTTHTRDISWLTSVNKRLEVKTVSSNTQQFTIVYVLRTNRCRFKHKRVTQKPFILLICSHPAVQGQEVTLHYLHMKGHFRCDSLGCFINDWKVNYAHNAINSLTTQLLFYFDHIALISVVS